MIKYLTSELITYQFVWIAVVIIFFMLIGRCVYLRFKLSAMLDENFGDILDSALNENVNMKIKINNIVIELGKQYLDKNNNISDEDVELFYFDYFIKTQELIGMNNYKNSDIKLIKEEIHNKYKNVK